MTDFKGPYDVVIIGAGPAGAVASALLNSKSYRVLILEKQQFPRFSIGESLLPQCMTFLEQAGMMNAVESAGFQKKNGATFSHQEKSVFFDFSEKFSSGWETTFQVQRGRFDKILADEAQRQGVEIGYGQTITGFKSEQNMAQLEVQDETGKSYQVSTKFVLDASGFGRVLPRLLDLNRPSKLASRTSMFTHVKDNIKDESFDRNKILICVHPEQQDTWYWLIPFDQGRASVGVIVAAEALAEIPGTEEYRLRELIAQEHGLGRLLANAEFDTRVGLIDGYSADVKQMYGSNFALLGNAGEFLDPVFSSGVTIALKSASLAADTLDRHLKGLNPDWDMEFARPLMRGVDVFREFVNAWYDGRLQDIIFAADKTESVKRMICSVLAGYVWDIDNPYVKDSSRLDTLAELCRKP